MFVFLVIDNEKRDLVKRQVANRGYAVMAGSETRNFMVVNVPNFQDNSDAHKVLEGELLEIDGITEATTINRYLDIKSAELKKALKSKTCRMFFDVDSTLTRGKPGTLHPHIQEIFTNLERKKNPCLSGDGTLNVRTC